MRRSSLSHAPADLFIGSEADSNQPVLPLCLPEQSLDQGHDHRHTRLVVRTEQCGAAGGHNVFAQGGSKLRRCRWIESQTRVIREPDDAAIVFAMKNGFDVFAGAVRSRVHVSEKGHGRHAGFARVGGDTRHDVTVLCHLHVRCSQFTQLLLQHLQQDQLTWRARKCVTGLVRLRIDLDVAQES